MVDKLFFHTEIFGVFSSIIALYHSIIVLAFGILFSNLYRENFDLRAQGVQLKQFLTLRAHLGALANALKLREFIGLCILLVDPTGNKLGITKT